MSPDFYTNRTSRLLLSGYPVELITITSTPSDTPKVCCHKHAEIEFQYVAKGSACITCDGEDICAGEGDIVFVNQSVKHFISFPTNIDTEVFSIIVHPSFLLSFGQLELENKYLSPIISDSSLRYLHICPDHEMYADLVTPLEHLISRNNDRASGYELMSKSYLLQIWYVIYNFYQNSFHDIMNSPDGMLSHLTKQDEQRVKQACIYIHEHYMDPITLDDIADSILVSKSECCRCFKRSCGVTPFEYLMKYRIAQSTKHMNLKANESISEISGLVGFNNTSYFNKVFKKYMGCTPTEYCRSLSAS